MSLSRGVRRRFSGRAPGYARRTRYHCPSAPRGTKDCEGWYLFLNVKAAGRSSEFLEEIVSFRWYLPAPWKLHASPILGSC